MTVGWLGSKSTVKYLRLIEPVLQELARAHPRTCASRSSVAASSQMDGVPWVHTEWSLDAELQALQRFDIGLMPLPQEDWANGKSGGKARTYMAAGVVPVCQDIGYNRQLIRPGETGFLCTTPQQWRQTLEQADRRRGAAPAGGRGRARRRGAALLARWAGRRRCGPCSTRCSSRRARREGRLMAAANMTPAVVLGLSPTGLYAVRELGRAGVPVVGVCSEWQTGSARRAI